MDFKELENTKLSRFSLEEIKIIFDKIENKIKNCVRYVAYGHF